MIAAGGGPGGREPWWRQRAQRFRGRHGLFVALIVGGVIAGAVVPTLMFGERTSAGYGQVGLLPGDSVPHGWHRCTGAGRFADVKSRARLYVTSGSSTTILRISDGHLLANGRCEFPFTFKGAGRPDLVFEIRNVARWSVTEVDLTRPLELTVDQASTL
jgi:hypothetical protein